MQPDSEFAGYIGQYSIWIATVTRLNQALDKPGLRGRHAALCRLFRRKTSVLEDLPSECSSMGGMEDKTNTTIHGAVVHVLSFVGGVLYTPYEYVQVWTLFLNVNIIA